MKRFAELYGTFFKIGLFTFGGGYAMLPLLEREVVEDKGWISHDQILDYYAIGQVTPGIIAVNTSTFCGYSQAGVPGAILASLGFITPSIIVISLIASVLKEFADLAILQHAFSGIRVAVSCLVLKTVISMVKEKADSKSKFLVFLLSFAGIAFAKLSPIPIVVGVAIVGLLAGRRKC